MLFRRKFTVRGRSPVRAIPQFYRQLMYGVVLLMTLSLLGAGIWYVARLPSLTISTIEVVGGETVPHAHLESLVEAELAGNYLRLIPYRFSPLYPAEAIRKRVLAEPRVQQASLEKIDATTIRLTFAEYRPVALWCGERSETASCYFLDDQGYAFANAPPLRGGAFIRYSVETEPRVSERSILNKGQINRTTDLVTKLSERYGFRVQDIVFTRDGDEEYWLKDGSLLKIAATTDVTTILADLDAILSADEFDHLKPGNFSYIDLRFKNKAFVNETIPGTVASSTSATTTATTSLFESP